MSQVSLQRGFLHQHGPQGPLNGQDYHPHYQGVEKGKRQTRRMEVPLETDN